MRMPLIPPPYVDSSASYLAAMQMAEEPAPSLQLLKSLDDLDEEADEDDDEVEDLDDDDEEDEDDLEDDYDEDEDEDEEDDDEEDDDDEEEDEDEDGGVKPLKMGGPSFGTFRT